MISDTTIEVSVFVETGAAGHALPVLQQLHLEGVDLKVISSGETDRFEKARAVLFFLAHVPDMNPTAAGRTTAETLFEGLSASGIPVMALIPDPATAPSSEEWQRIQKNLAIVDLQNAFIARLREDTLCRVANLTDAEQHSAEVCAAVETLSMLVKSQESLTEDHTYVANPPRLHTPYRYPLHNNVFVGREADQQALTAWAAESEQPVYALIAMGGSGKSALAWNWLQEGAMTVTEPFEGYFWWDFYHDSDCEKCIAQLLTYLSGGSYGLLLKRSLQKNLEELQSHLNGRRILICLDGVERILNHYREFDADAHDALGAEDDDTGVDVWYRACARQEGTFLQALTGMHLSKALLTSRLLPVDLEVDGEVHPGVHVSDRLQMLPDDVLALMHRLEVKASEKVVDKISGLVGGHPLALRALAGAVKSDHRGDLDSWFAENGEFDVASLDLVGRRSHILRHAMMGIGARSLALLGAAAAFRGPASLDDLVSVLLTGGDLLTSDREVQAGLKDLKDRQLLFLDEANGQVDMHPLVRGVVWKGLDQTWKEILAEQHGRYFQNLTRDLDLSTSASFNALRHHWFSLIERRRRDEAVKAITPSVHEHIVTHGRAVDVSLMFEALLESAESLSEPVTNDIDRRWEFHYWYSFALSYSGRPASAAEQMVEALAVAGHAGDADGERSQDQKARSSSNLRECAGTLACTAWPPTCATRQGFGPEPFMTAKAKKEFRTFSPGI